MSLIQNDNLLATMWQIWEESVMEGDWVNAQRIELEMMRGAFFKEGMKLKNDREYYQAGLVG